MKLGVRPLWVRKEKRVQPTEIYTVEGGFVCTSRLLEETGRMADSQPEYRDAQLNFMATMGKRYSPVTEEVEDQGDNLRIVVKQTFVLPSCLFHSSNLPLSTLFLRPQKRYLGLRRCEPKLRRNTR
ncbi:hypothetical protein KC320_g146 [Hortaea werneckii]|nr:hypothetical protein KC320_g146 [Hortaea werneckii]